MDNLFLLRVFERLQKGIVFFKSLLLVIEVKHLVLFDGDHLFVVNETVVVRVQNSHQFFELLSCHWNAHFFNTTDEFCFGDFFTVVFVELSKKIHHAEASEFYVLQQQI